MPGQALLGDCFRSGSTTPASRSCCIWVPGLPGPAGSAGTREAPEGAREARLLRGIDEKGERRRGLQKGRPPRPAVMARPGSQLDGGSGLLPCRGSYARGALSERHWEPGPRSVALTARFVCSQKSAREGRVLLFPPRNVTNDVEPRLGLK